MSGAVRLDGPLNREVLQRALNRIVMRHEALRTCFAREEGEPIQVIQPHADLTVSYHDLREAESSQSRTAGKGPEPSPRIGAIRPEPRPAGASAAAAIGG